MSRALVLGSGGLRGAYSGGVVATFGRELGYDYFDALYTCSAGSYTGAYFASRQSDIIEAIWRECVHGRLLMRWRNIFRSGQPILDLFYLNSVLQSRKYQLSAENLLRSRMKISIVATECHSGVAHYFSPKTSQEFFLQVRASAAVPYLHPKVVIEGRGYIDGGLSDPLPIERALADGHDEVIAVCNQPRLEKNCFDILLPSVCAIKFQGRRQMFLSLAKQRRIRELVEKNKSCVKVIFPSSELPVRWRFDSSKDHINQLVDLGIRDALAFLA